MVEKTVFRLDLHMLGETALPAAYYKSSKNGNRNDANSNSLSQKRVDHYLKHHMHCAMFAMISLIFLF